MQILTQRQYLIVRFSIRITYKISILSEGIQLEIRIYANQNEISHSFQIILNNRYLNVTVFQMSRRRYEIKSKKYKVDFNFSNSRLIIQYYTILLLSIHLVFLYIVFLFLHRINFIVIWKTSHMTDEKYRVHVA